MTMNQNITNKMEFTYKDTLLMIGTYTTIFIACMILRCLMGWKKLKICIEFFKIPQEDIKYVEKAIDDVQYDRVVDEMASELKRGNYSILACKD